MSADTQRPGLLALIREDIACVFDRDPAARSTLEIIVTYPGVHALVLHRLAHRLWRSRWRFAARFLGAFTRWLTNVDIHPGADIGRRFFIDHGAGVVIGETTVIGDDCTLYHGVTLGGATWNKGKRHPTLGNQVLVGAGAKVLGAIEIGDNARIGANAVVVTDVPKCRTAVGIPGRVVQERTVRLVDSPYGIDLNHHLIPDPMGRAIACMQDRISELEKRLKDHTEAEESECHVCEAETVCDPDKNIALDKAG